MNLVPNDPLFSQQYHHQLISTPTAWDTTTGSPNVVIAVLDTGVSTTHLDLAGRIWTNPGESPGNANVDDDQNGLIDDIQGWDFIGNDRNPSPVPKIVAGKFHPKDSSTHGTMVAGAAAATLNNAFGIAGVAGGVSILPLRVCSFTGCDDNAINRARRYAADVVSAAGAHVIINESFGSSTPHDRADLEALDYAYGKGALIVKSAGNGNDDQVGDANVPFHEAGLHVVVARRIG